MRGSRLQCIVIAAAVCSLTALAAAASAVVGLEYTEANNDLDTGDLTTTDALAQQQSVPPLMQDALDEFLQWASEEGIEVGESDAGAKTLELRLHPTMGLSIFASQAIEASTTTPLLSVPLSTFFARFTLLDSPMMAALAVRPVAREEAKLSLLFLYEYFDPDSFWQPWFQLFPRELDCAGFWDDLLLMELDNTSIRDAIRQLEALIEYEYDQLDLPALRLRFPDSFVADRFSYDDFKWAFMVLASRGLTMSVNNAPCTVMIPFVDFFNHNGAKSIAFSYTRRAGDASDVSSGNYDDSVENLNCAVISGNETFLPGEQMFLNYKAHSNEVLLLHYGFALPHNEHDTFLVRLHFDREKTNDPLMDLREHLLELRGIQENHPFLLRWHGDIIDPDILFALRVMIATKDQLDFLLEEGIASNSPFSVDSELVATVLLQRSLERNQAKFATTIESDEFAEQRVLRRLEETEPESPAMRGLIRELHAIRYRMGQKRLLAFALAQLAQLQAELDLNRITLDATYPFQRFQQSLHEQDSSS
ncbi:hypothetical protein CAOG_08575 [Capsaspora owczarzaki ATCC 30864]|uniref:Rubisco LSMT substrate-binding domain-containing protein n=1 Tax=Capsaspora owczarzaki (strain ATCC 30864) TaxID=595528 RepID=A0A0D2WKK1_CAPO3|nr:hypothetical protein CAOG_08575 [Capsaspora owczarzaki ATCC 30864]KJE90830.1 hypothetical protein CAOG_008575 [Capsaspora owczarzaki ATCC 30864]|eukprot:XP_011270175.1 hypothetical protein CAOG_08575 [Capsaspora owczarzaki ATCC 30864]